MKVGVFMIALSAALTGSLALKSLVFSSETATSYVEVIPQKPLSMKAFTLCMLVATELSGNREVILFAYRTRDTDELNVWCERNGSLSFYLRENGVIFNVPQLSAMQTHLCVTWDSSSGAGAFFLNGKRSLTKIHKSQAIRPGGRIVLGQDPDAFRPGARILIDKYPEDPDTSSVDGSLLGQDHPFHPVDRSLLGQDPDTFLGGFDINQCFVGEISTVNMWDSVLSNGDIQDMFSGNKIQSGNVIDWESAELKVKGEVAVINYKL